MKHFKVSKYCCTTNCFCTSSFNSPSFTTILHSSCSPFLSLTHCSHTYVCKYGSWKYLHWSWITGCQTGDTLLFGWTLQLSLNNRIVWNKPYGRVPRFGVYLHYTLKIHKDVFTVHPLNMYYHLLQYVWTVCGNHQWEITIRKLQLSVELKLMWLLN